jgi:hypothetical protein
MSFYSLLPSCVFSLAQTQEPKILCSKSVQKCTKIFANFSVSEQQVNKVEIVNGAVDIAKKQQ